MGWGPQGKERDSEAWEPGRPALLGAGAPCLGRRVCTRVCVCQPCQPSLTGGCTVPHRQRELGPLAGHGVGRGRCDVWAPPALAEAPAFPAVASTPACGPVALWETLMPRGAPAPTPSPGPGPQRTPGPSLGCAGPLCFPPEAESGEEAGLREVWPDLRLPSLAGLASCGLPAPAWPPACPVPPAAGACPGGGRSGAVLGCPSRPPGPPRATSLLLSGQGYRTLRTKERVPRFRGVATHAGWSHDLLVSLEPSRRGGAAGFPLAPQVCWPVAPGP